MLTKNLVSPNSGLITIMTEIKNTVTITCLLTKVNALFSEGSYSCENLAYGLCIIKAINPTATVYAVCEWFTY